MSEVASRRGTQFMRRHVPVVLVAAGLCAQGATTARAEETEAERVQRSVSAVVERVRSDACPSPEVAASLVQTIPSGPDDEVTVKFDLLPYRCGSGKAWGIAIAAQKADGGIVVETDAVRLEEWHSLSLGPRTTSKGWEHALLTLRAPGACEDVQLDYWYRFSEKDPKSRLDGIESRSWNYDSYDGAFGPGGTLRFSKVYGYEMDEEHTLVQTLDTWKADGSDIRLVERRLVSGAGEIAPEASLYVEASTGSRVLVQKATGLARLYQRHRKDGRVWWKVWANGQRGWMPETSLILGQLVLQTDDEPDSVIAEDMPYEEIDYAAIPNGWSSDSIGIRCVEEGKLLHYLPLRVGWTEPRGGDPELALRGRALYAFYPGGCRMEKLFENVDAFDAEYSHGLIGYVRDAPEGKEVVLHRLKDGQSSVVERCKQECRLTLGDKWLTVEEDGLLRHLEISPDWLSPR